MNIEELRKLLWAAAADFDAIEACGVCVVLEPTEKHYLLIDTMIKRAEKARTEILDALLKEDPTAAMIKEMIGERPAFLQTGDKNDVAIDKLST